MRHAPALPPHSIPQTSYGAPLAPLAPLASGPRARCAEHRDSSVAKPVVWSADVDVIGPRRKRSPSRALPSISLLVEGAPRDVVACPVHVPSPGAFRVRAGHERSHLLVANLDELERPRAVDAAAGTVQRPHDPVDAIAGIAVDAPHPPGGEALEEVVRDRGAHEELRSKAANAMPVATAYTA